MNQDNWCICCPGPSLGLYKTRKKIILTDFDVRVAINGAILFDNLYYSSFFDYWAAVDIEVLDSVFKLTNEGSRLGLPTLWIPDYWEDHMHKGFPHLVNFFNSFQSETFPTSGYLSLESIFKSSLGIEWSEPTLFSAIALAIKKEAKVIKIFGADMSGEKYFKEGLSNNRTRHNEKRWESARLWLNQVIYACKQRGITVTREI